MRIDRLLPSTQVSSWISNSGGIPVPGRGSGGFRADMYSGCIGWWDVSRISGYADGATITTLTDLSLSARNLTGTGTYNTNQRNGLPTLSLSAHFSGAQTTGIEFTMVIVGYIDPSFANNIFYNGGSNGYGIYGNNDLRIHYGNVAFITGPATSAGWMRLIMTGSSGTDVLYKNGASIVTGLSTPNTPNGTMQIFTGTTSKLCEAIFYNRQLTSGERGELDAALAIKWGW